MREEKKMRMALQSFLFKLTNVVGKICALVLRCLLIYSQDMYYDPDKNEASFIQESVRAGMITDFK